MLAKPFNANVVLNRWHPPYIIQPKLNGLRGRAKRQPDGTYLLFSSEGNIIISLPHINRDLQKYMTLDHIDGEFYSHELSMTGASGILSIVKRSNSLHTLSQEIQFHVFDIIDKNIQSKRLRQLDEIFKAIPQTSSLVRVPYSTKNDLEGILESLDAHYSLGFEGIIIRNSNAFYETKRTSSMFKIKPTQKDYYEIIGYEEEISIHGEPKNCLGSLRCQTNNEEPFWVGSGFTRDQRYDLWINPDALIGKYCYVKYQELTTRGVPWAPVVLEITDTNPEVEGDFII